MPRYLNLPATVFVSPFLVAATALAQGPTPPADSCSGTWPVPGTTVSGDVTTVIGYVSGSKVTFIADEPAPIGDIASRTLTKTVHDCYAGFWRELGHATTQESRSLSNPDDYSENTTEVNSRIYDGTGALYSSHRIWTAFEYGLDNGERTCRVQGETTTTGPYAYDAGWEHVIKSTPAGVFKSVDAAAESTATSPGPSTAVSTFSLDYTPAVVRSGLYTYRSESPSGGSTFVNEASAQLAGTDFWRTRAYVLPTVPAWVDQSAPVTRFINYSNSNTTVVASMYAGVGSTQLHMTWPLAPCAISNGAIAIAEENVE